MSSYAAEVRDVWKVYAAGGSSYPALRGVTLKIPKGSFVVVLGPSGSGKSTLLHLLGALDTPTKGEVIIAGKNVKELDEEGRARLRREYVGFVFQKFYLINRLSAVENVELPMLAKGLPKAERRRRALALLKKVGLGEKAFRRPTELSGGEQQRVAIARALANDPDIILADEPTGNLDTANATRIMKLLEALNVEMGKTVVVVTHNPEHTRYANYVVRIRDGKVESVEEGGRPAGDPSLLLA
ncbi:ABC transporter ATP-binding protein [Ignicoccus hospitalis]|uniref:ABC transporter related n=1 Tax=Ignicoccus hospitalis (strain KIN4/I / DSM 18386 / JCM 14125) TaxID=453591 RepID=A8A8U5_IGNH4|nr:ABC transporter ATP-binding protein [Ignicoccus hospitalis]ABU81347.1 ABC transporter related [Ignicoccus hospitalis KIN4/I]HIH90349.1 ABC transporter ATP-binding protein [Desulfurococcaceae archaeon]